ncbi:MAG: hypothetical protein EXR62_10910 [Chloroflexi bacterium]|nr:hypothetical protein [Chloroflexota bacterium]
MHTPTYGMYSFGGVGTAVTVLVGVAICVAVEVLLGMAVAICVAVEVLLGMAVAICVAVEVLLGMAVAVLVPVGIDVLVAVGVGELVVVRVADGVFNWDGHPHQKGYTSSLAPNVKSLSLMVLVMLRLGQRMKGAPGCFVICREKGALEVSTRKIALATPLPAGFSGTKRVSIPFLSRNTNSNSFAGSGVVASPCQSPASKTPLQPGHGKPPPIKVSTKTTAEIIPVRLLGSAWASAVLFSPKTTPTMKTRAQSMDMISNMSGVRHLLFSPAITSLLLRVAVI